MFRRIIWLFLILSQFAIAQDCGQLCNAIDSISFENDSHNVSYCPCLNDTLTYLSSQFDQLDNHDKFYRLQNNINQQTKIINKFKKTSIPDSIYLPYYLDLGSFLLYTNQLEEAARKFQYIRQRIDVIDPNLSKLQYAEIYSLALQGLSDISSAQSKFVESNSHLNYSILAERQRAEITKGRSNTGTMQNKIGRNYLDLRDTLSAYEYLDQGNQKMKAAIPTLSEYKRKRFFAQFNTHISYEIEAALALGKLEEAVYLFTLIDKVTFDSFPPFIELELLRVQLAKLQSDTESAFQLLDSARSIAYRNETSYEDQILYHVKRSFFEEKEGFLEQSLAHLDTANIISDDVITRSSKWTRNMVQARTERIKLLSRLGKSEETKIQITEFIHEIQHKLSGLFLLEDQVRFIVDFYPIFELGLEITHEDQTEENLALAFDIMECVSSLSLYKEATLADGPGDEKKERILKEYKESSALYGSLLTQNEINDSLQNQTGEIYLVNNRINELKKELLDSREISRFLELIEYQNFIPKEGVHILTFAGNENYYFLKMDNKEASLFKFSTGNIDSLAQGFLNTLSDINSKSYQPYARQLGEIFSAVKGSAFYRDLYFTGDGSLRLIPLEALIIDGDFLLNKEISVTYAPSARLQYKLNQFSSSAKPTTVIFRPTFTDKIALDYAIKETENIFDITSGKIYEESEATIENFFSKSESYDVIHLATHAESFPDNSARSYIEFSNGQLYFEQIKSLFLQANLVYMGACETNLGKNYNGEGVMSLARNFMASGARSVISSLWKISDQSTSEITTSFYTHLKNGDSKSLALKKAKQDWISAHPHEGSHPYYWAGLILTGNEQALFKPVSWFTYLGFASILVLAGFVIGFVLRKRNKQSLS